jgi:uncharacterized protein (DUF488 family)
VAKQVIYTIGHSTHPIDHFLHMLQAYSIETLVDVRTVPRSRHNPQFDQKNLEQSLRNAGMEYVHMASLGGLRHASKDSPNTGWRNSSFRGYADYMQTESFEQAIEALIALSKQSRCVIMCAEAVPWRCHRSLVGDALLVRSLSVNDIMTEKTSQPHKLTPWARVDGTSITYPAASDAAPST